MADTPQTSMDDSKCWRCDLGISAAEGLIGYQWGVIAEEGIGGGGGAPLIGEGGENVIGEGAGEQILG